MTTINTEYEDLLRLVKATGVHKEDRTGTGTTSAFGHQMRFNLQEGFPLVTTKKVFMRGIAEELFWFLKGNTNAKWLQKKNVKIWDEWSPLSGDLGPVYGASWRAIYAPSNHNVQVSKGVDHNSKFSYPFNELLPSIDYDLNTKDIWAIEILDTSEIRVQLASGFVTTIIRSDWQDNKNMASLDGYAKNFNGVGFLGEATPADAKVFQLWKDILGKVYNPDDEKYIPGFEVSPLWHSFEYFAMSISEAPGYHLWVSGEDLILDTTYLDSNIYSPTTTVFIKKENIESSTTVDPNLPSPAEGKIWRKRLYVDQIEDVMEQIRNNPDSRRMIVMAWNPPALPDQALPPCHAFFQFYVADGKLSCQLYQRSTDIFLGLPFNIASYALLTHMIAQQTGLEVGDFVWTGGDNHIYDNLQEQVDLQLTREPYPFPTLKLNKRDSIYDYEWKDIEVENYQHHPAIKGQVAV